MNPVYGYRNTIAAYQTPKSSDGPPQSGLAVLNDKTQPSKWESSKYRYTPGSWSWISTRMGDSGEADERPAWRCPDCGVEREPQSDAWECCSRCGSTDEPKWR